MVSFKEWRMYSGKRTSIAVLVLSLLAFAQPLLALNGLTPQIGTWAITEEISGKPGRGFQIDVQNDILVL
jgi:hypothetical protein